MEPMTEETSSKTCGCEHGGESCKSCKCPHHMIPSIIVVLFGLLFLLKALDVIAGEVVAIVWPILVILMGGMKLTAGKCKCC